MKRMRFALLIGSWSLFLTIGFVIGPAAVPSLADGRSPVPMEMGSAPEPRPDAALDVCFDPEERFFFKDSDGAWRGVEHDILAAFAAERGLSLRLHDPDGLPDTFAALGDGRCQVASSRITRTAERGRHMDFSAAYFPARIVAVEKRSSLTTRPDQLRGKRAAVHRGSSYVDAVHRLQADPVWVADIRPAFEAVSRGEADFLACDSAFVLGKLHAFPDLRVTVPLSERQQLAFALTKDSDLTAPLSRFIEDLHADGEYRRILSRYYDPEGVAMILGEP